MHGPNASFRASHLAKPANEGVNLMHRRGELARRVRSGLTTAGWRAHRLG
jgi:hypothetical protein